MTLGQEMWTADKTPAQTGLLLSTVNEMSDWSKDNINAQPITIVGIDLPALEWLLRGHPSLNRQCVGRIRFASFGNHDGSE